MTNTWLSRYTKTLAFLTFLLVIAGGLVTSTKSGLSVPDWPLSYGKLMPPMVGGVRYEHSHRIIASTIGALTFVLMFWIGFTEKRAWLRRIGILAFGLVVAQGILGGLTVIYLLPPPISILHACIAQTFFALTVCMAYFTSREWSDATTSSPALIQIKPSLVMLIVLIYMQLILGATLRHTSNHIVVVSHIVGAFMVLIHGVVVMMKTLNNPGNDEKINAHATAVGVLSFLQILLGAGAFVYVMMLKETLQPSTAKVIFVTAHQSVGALLLALSIFLLVRIYRRVKAS